MRLSLRMIPIFLICLFLVPDAQAGRELERNPIKNTQTDPVPVTEELLNRESESGPASPSFRMSDTSGFFMKKPYNLPPKEDLLDVNLDAEDASVTKDWNDWFEIQKEQVESTEIVDEQELK